MKIPRVLLAGILLSLAASQCATAATIVGTLPVTTFGTGLTPGNADLSTATQIHWTSMAATNTGTGDLSVITSGTSFNPAGVLDLGSLTSFSYHFLSGSTDYGTFTAGAGSFIVSQSPSFLDIYLLGTFAPAGGLPGFDAGPASLRLSFTYANVGGQVSVSGSGTLSSPPAAPPGGIPEPASLALVGIGLVSVTAFRSLRKRVSR
jgi:hypothetical protein